ncbi:S26 family signal peptidase [Streptomyces sp. NPDC057539]|uniref:S26 family signal peptidase n=1 Tax=Streptomyces sp. NPDC057539 TaxID=3346159 RepID=UPI003675F222
MTGHGWRAAAWARGGVPVLLVGFILVTGALLRRRFVAVVVRGVSMEPAYRDGDRVLVRREAALVPGRVVVVERPDSSSGWTALPLSADAGPRDVSGREWMIKRVAAVPGNPVPRDTVPAPHNAPGVRVPPEHLVLLGDNRDHSFDSRQAGYFPAERVLGVALRLSGR